MFGKRGDIQKYIAVVEAGSLHEAAAALGSSQPALSRLIAKWEQEHNAVLFERVPRGLLLTPTGALLEEQCRRILNEFEAAESELQSHISGRQGSLHLSAGPVWTFAILPQILPIVHRTHPGLELSLTSRGYHDAIRMLERGEIDVHLGVFDHEMPLPRNITKIPMTRVTLGIVAGSHHPIFEGPASVDALCDYIWLDYMAGRWVSERTWPTARDLEKRIFERTGRRFQSVLNCDTTALALMSVAPYLAHVPVELAEAIPGMPIRHVPVDLDFGTYNAGLILRRSLLRNPVITTIVDLHRTFWSSRGVGGSKPS